MSVIWIKSPENRTSCIFGQSFVSAEGVFFHRVGHVVPTCFHSSPEQPKPLAVQRFVHFLPWVLRSYKVKLWVMALRHQIYHTGPLALQWTALECWRPGAMDFVPSSHEVRHCGLSLNQERMRRDSALVSKSLPHPFLALGILFCWDAGAWKGTSSFWRRTD